MTFTSLMFQTKQQSGSVALGLIPTLATRRAGRLFTPPPCLLDEQSLKS